MDAGFFTFCLALYFVADRRWDHFLGASKGGRVFQVPYITSRQTRIYKMDLCRHFPDPACLFFTILILGNCNRWTVSANSHISLFSCFGWVVSHCNKQWILELEKRFDCFHINIGTL